MTVEDFIGTYVEDNIIEVRVNGDVSCYVTRANAAVLSDPVRTAKVVGWGIISRTRAYLDCEVKG